VRGRRIAAALAATLCVATAPAGAAQAAKSPPCTNLGFSPAFARDRVMFCSYDEPQEGAYLARSDDGGRTWQPGRLVATGVADVFNAPVFVSPWFPTDHRVFVTMESGLSESTDGGRTFHPVPPPPGGGTDGAWGPSIAGFRDPATAPAGPPREAFVYSAWDEARVYTPGVGTRTILGAPTEDATLFLVPPDYPSTRRAVLLAHSTGVVWPDPDAKPFSKTGLVAYDCVGDFVCTEPLFWFGDVAARFMGPLGRPGSFGVTTIDFYKDDQPKDAWRTADYGRTWQRWPSLKRLIDAVPKDTAPTVTVTVSPDAPDRLYALVDTYVPRFYVNQDTLPHTFFLYRSDDDGATWRSVGTSSPTMQASTLPWNFTHWRMDPTIAAVPGGRLYVNAAHRTRSGKVDYWGVYCSADGARTWRRGGCGHPARAGAPGVREWTAWPTTQRT
jgi:hypothetical protein